MVRWKKRTLPQVRRRIRTLIKKWIPILGLEEWTLRVTFKPDKTDAGWCRADTKDRKATVNFDLEHIRERWFEEMDEVEFLVVHELVHAVEWRASERAVDQIARALLIVEAQKPHVRAPIA